MSREDHGELRTWAVVLGAAAVLIVIGALVGLPMLEGGIAVLQEGMPLKTAALWAFGVSVTLMVVFAIAAGDGFIGEIQFMLAGFFLFFVIITLLIAWIF